MSDLNIKNPLNNFIYEMLILSALETKDCRGYEVYQKILEYSDNKLEITPDEIYTGIYKLLDSGMLTENNNIASHIYYHITPAGEIYLNKLLHSYYINITVIGSTLYKFEKEQNNTPQGFIQL